jgi:hypothetical protein
MNRILGELLRWGRVRPAVAASTRWMTWARGIAARHRPVVGRFPPPRMGLLPPSPGGTTEERHQHVKWSVSRNLQVAVHPVLVALTRIEAAPVTEAAGVGAVARIEQRVEAAIGPLQRVVASAAAAADTIGGPLAYPPRAVLAVDNCQRTLRRVVEERRRIEEWTRPSEPGRAHSPAPPASEIRGGAPVPAPLLTPARAVVARTGRQASDAPLAAGTPQARAPQPAPGQPGPGQRDAAAAASPAPRIDVRQLTEQVVRQIDEEIVAHRERMGRI